MMRTYEYHGFTLQVSAESNLSFQPIRQAAARSGYVAVVRVFQAGNAVGIFSPLRFGEARGRPFDTEVDALTGGYSAARRIVDDLFGH
ncbi:hypothetical protein B0G74_9039 [Paraburkholderia sp. BL9I2N2]|nr:hypothetical protein B0G74_9039 [Paraburkholderia sp. BL9I2N2]